MILKRVIDIVLSLLSLMILAHAFLILMITIRLDSKEPVFFKQKRVGIHKSHFHIFKSRTMRIDTSKDTPTHLLENPDQWITKVGKFLRKASLDELPEIWNIFVWQMSIIGPRPALWNQYDLIEERDKYNANDVPVGLTGWAQANGRDTVLIEDKARYDDIYSENIGFMADVKGFFRMILPVVKSDGVFEGGTWDMGHYFKIIDGGDGDEMKNILITGKNSYIGTSLENWLSKEPDKYKVDTVDMRADLWKEKDFSEYDVVFHVAAVVHKKEKPEMKDLYFMVNKDLPIEVAKKARESGVTQLIFMSTMAVYGQEGKIGEELFITRQTPVNPKTYYGVSKVEAENELNKLGGDRFKVVVLRPPMVYGSNCPGNYARLENLAIKLPVFPMIENKRSMLHIDKLCHYVKEYIDNEVAGMYFPQDDEYVNTSILVKNLADKNGKKIILSKTLGWIIKLIGKRVDLINKVFGNLVYEK